MITDFGVNVDKYLQDKTENDDRDYSYIHPSDFGGCLVATWFKMMGEKPMVPLGANKIRIFDNGHYLHLRNQIYAKESGVLAYDTVIAEPTNESIIIGTEEKNKIKIVGETGREYYYSYGETIWRKNMDHDFFIGTDNAPYWDKIDNLKKGDSWWLVEVPLVDPVYHFGGHCDAIVLNNGIETIIDYKGISDYSWPYQFRDENKKYLTSYPDRYNSSCFICGANMQKAKDLSEHFISAHSNEVVIDFKYKIQLHIYMMILNVKQSILWCENKNNQIILDYPIERDDELIDKIQKNAIKFWNKFISGEKPSRQPGYTRSKKPCSYCDYAFQCWNN